MTTTTKVEPKGAIGGAVPLDSVPDPLDDAMEQRMLSCAERILAVMERIGDIPKSDYNEGQRFYYRSVDRVIAATRDAMIEFRLLAYPVRIVPETETEERKNNNGKDVWTRLATLKVVYAFVNADEPEDTIEVEVVAEANDVGDKAVSQAMTAAHKAVMLQTFQIGDSGSDGDSGTAGSDLPEEPEWAAEEEIEAIKVVLDSLDEQGRRIARAAWTPRWGSVARGRIRADVLNEIGTLLSTLSTPAPAEDHGDEVAAK